MDNYLSYRWPDQDPDKQDLPQNRDLKSEWKRKLVLAPETGPIPRRRILKNVLIVVIVAAVIVALVLAGWFFTGALMENQKEDQGSSSGRESSVQEETEYASDSEGELTTTVGRAETGLGIVIEEDQSELTVLSASEIYELVVPSVVNIAVLVPQESGVSVGSGIILHEDGYILTNYHVVEGASEISVLLYDDSAYSALLVGYDEAFDIAVIKIEAKGLVPARIGSSDILSVGDPAYAIGNAMGYLYGTMTDGIISALGRELQIGGNDMTLIQTSAALNSGNSGGALINQYGQVVGVTVARVSERADSASAEGLGLAIPISDVLPFINRILDTGETWRPAIGITCSEVEVGGVSCILVASVNEDSSAYEAGLQEGDLILTANGKEADSLYHLKRVLYDVGAEGYVTCTIQRDGKKFDLTFQLYDSMQE